LHLTLDADIVGGLSDISTLQLWGFLIIVYLTIYMDFSAYSDIAIGCSRLFGLRIQENFDFPIIASNVGDFWHRWHMTLSGWCTSYIYMPVLAFSRNPYLALYSCFAIIGLWHAGTFTRLSWGLYHATGIAIYMVWTRYKRKRRWNKPITGMQGIPGIILTQLFISTSMAFLVVEDNGQGMYSVMKIMAKLFFLDVSN
jgi:alginate O-acetyltransferase complex protein AlgI